LIARWLDRRSRARSGQIGPPLPLASPVPPQLRPRVGAWPPRGWSDRRVPAHQWRQSYSTRACASAAAV